MSDSDVEIIDNKTNEIEQNKAKNGPPVYTGVFAALNILHSTVEEESPKGSVVPLSSLNPAIRQGLFETNWSIFEERVGGVNTLLFGPIKIYSNSPDFASNVTLSEEAFSMLLNDRRLSAILFCLRDSDTDASPFWPARFSVSINEKLYEAPQNYPPNTSATFWMDITNAIKSEYMKLHIYSNRVLSGTPYYVVGMVFHPTTNVELIAKITKHEGIENWQKLYKLSDPEDAFVVESCLTIPLVCPLSQGRISIPIRGEKCEHISCFDADSYFKYQRFVGTWKCPICNRDCPPEELYIDDIYCELLRRTDLEIDSLKVNYQGISK